MQPVISGRAPLRLLLGVACLAEITADRKMLRGYQSLWYPSLESVWLGSTLFTDLVWISPSKPGMESGRVPRYRAPYSNDYNEKI